MATKKIHLRLDELLVQQGLSENLNEARAFIMAGKVIVNNNRCDSAAIKFTPDVKIRIRGLSRFVSRGGEKLLSAIESLNLKDSFINSVVLDVGASTGGFTDCVLQHNAKLVIALDVGTNQLDWKLRQNEHVICLEKTDIREFKKNDYPNIDWIVGDISFNSITNLADSIKNAGNSETNFLLLVKPQFELNPNEVPEGGIIDDENLRLKALEKVKIKLQELDLEMIKSVDSKVKGRFGNQEIFIWFKHKKV